MNQENSYKPQFLSVIAKERELLKAKRHKNQSEDHDYFGIALSGGGIRSATVNLGVLEVLNACHILEQADYLSSVSGGGYIAGFVTSHLKRDGQQAYRQMFSPPEIDRLRKYSFYLTPGRGQWLNINRIRLLGALVASFLMNCIWIAALAGYSNIRLEIPFKLPVLLLASGTPLCESHPIRPYCNLCDLDLEFLRPWPAPHSVLEFRSSQYLRRNSLIAPVASGRPASDQISATVGCEHVL